MYLFSFAYFGSDVSQYCKIALSLQIINQSKKNMRDFDQTIDRRQTGSMKWKRYGDRDVIPMWVADMDYKAAPAIQAALQRVTDYGIMGYTLAPQALLDVVVERLKNQHGWKTVRPEWIVWLPGLVPGLNLACRTVGTSHDGVMTATPVYFPFMSSPELSDRTTVKVPMKVENNRWTLDFWAIEAAIAPNTKMFMLCNPHNPTGTVFTEDELNKLTDICIKHNLVLCSDEIHCDLILDETTKHLSVAAIRPDIEQQSITLLSPSKTFNIAGLGASFAVIPNQQMRERFVQNKLGILPMLSEYAYEAALAAYQDCEEWRQDLLTYLRRNHDFLLTEINQLNGCKMLPLQATYLAWVDVQAAGIEDVVGKLEAAGVGVMDGQIFGLGGHIRINLGCTFEVLQEAVRRLKTVFTPQ